MPNEYNNDGKIIIRDSDGNEMSLPAFFKLALNDGNGNYARPTNARAGHNAWDMGVGVATTVPARTPVFGIVAECGDGWNGGMGTYAIIQEDNGRKHRFMHMIEGSLKVTAGAQVSQGDQLGIIGNTGDSYGAHLHYDVVVNGSKINDPIDAFDCTTLPTGWNFADAVANGNNWDYIPLDSHTDYGPPGGDTPGEPYYPDTPCHDIGWPQVASGSLTPCIDAIAAANHAGVIIQVGAIRSTGFEPDSSFNPADAVSAALNQNLGLGIYFYNYAPYETDATQAFQDALAYLETIGATTDKVKLGVWLDTEYNAGGGYDPTPNPDPAINYAYVERFINVFDAADYPVAGIYSSAANFSTWYGSSRIGDKPIWAAYWTGTFETVDRSTLDYYLPESDYTKVYLMQYSDNGTVPDWSNRLDCVKVLSPMPTASDEGGGGGGGGGGDDDYPEVITATVDIIPPKRIYFNPNPGVISNITDSLADRHQSITITTDAQNANLYYTVDGSAPYQYVYSNGTLVYTLAANAIHYTEPFTIYKDTHIRVVAVPTSAVPGSTFDTVLAKSSGTYLFAYKNLTQSWESEKKSYEIESGDVSFFEENKQAFLRYHDQLTTEDVLYAEVYAHDTQMPESDATDNATDIQNTKPEAEPPSTAIDNIDDMPESGD